MRSKLVIKRDTYFLYKSIFYKEWTNLHMSGQVTRELRSSLLEVLFNPIIIISRELNIQMCAIIWKFCLIVLASDSKG